MVRVCLAYPYIAGILTHVGNPADIFCCVFSFSAVPSRYPVHLSPHYSNVSTYAICSIPPGRTRPSTLVIAHSCLFCPSAFFTINFTTTDHPSLNLFWSFPIANLLDLVLIFHFRNPLLGFASLVPMRLFPRSFSFPTNRRHLTRD
jgi:hypothetical protein